MLNYLHDSGAQFMLQYRNCRLLYIILYYVIQRRRWPTWSQLTRWAACRRRQSPWGRAVTHSVATSTPSTPPDAASARTASSSCWSAWAPGGSRCHDDDNITPHYERLGHVPMTTSHDTRRGCRLFTTLTTLTSYRRQLYARSDPTCRLS